MMLPMPRYDKAVHFCYGVYVALLSMLFGLAVWHGAKGLPFRVELGYALWFSIITVVLFAVGKEAADWWANKKAYERNPESVPPHGVEKADLAWTTFGGGCVFVPSYSVAKLAGVVALIGG